MSVQNLAFRSATHADIGSIAAIHNANVRGTVASNNNGFLLTNVTEAEIGQRLEQGIQYFVATDGDDTVLGFVTVSTPTVNHDFLARIDWLDCGAKGRITQSGNIYIQVVAVKLGYMGQGIAQFLYKTLYSYFPDSFFTTFIVSKPIENRRSLSFHQQQGFKPIGIIRHDQFLDLKNYESLLLLKDFDCKDR